MLPVTHGTEADELDEATGAPPVSAAAAASAAGDPAHATSLAFISKAPRTERPPRTTSGKKKRYISCRHGCRRFGCDVSGVEALDTRATNRRNSGREDREIRHHTPGHLWLSRLVLNLAIS